jgi:hypothetical protein
VTARGNNALTVKYGALASAAVHLARDGNGSTFRVHGGGFIISRLINELRIARTVTSALSDAHRTPS